MYRPYIVSIHYGYLLFFQNAAFCRRGRNAAAGRHQQPLALVLPVNATSCDEERYPACTAGQWSWALDKEKNRKVAARILDRMDVITLRDPNAYEELKSLEVSKPVTMVAADPAMALAPCDCLPGLKILSLEGVPTDKNLVAFCLRKWKKVKRSEKILAALADKIADEFDLVPLFIPMQHPEDVRFIRKVMYHMTRTGYIMQKRYSVDETLSILGNVKMVVGMRLHSLIYAAN